MILIYNACEKMPNIIARPFYSYWMGMRATYGLGPDDTNVDQGWRLKLRSTTVLLYQN